MLPPRACMDFNAKKTALWQARPRDARRPSGLIYAKYRQQLEAKCRRAGVEFKKITPAYTSTIGAVNFAARRGWSVHAAAAGVIARRGQELSERLPQIASGCLARRSYNVQESGAQAWLAAGRASARRGEASAP
ncbi:hypothetical protein D9M72_561300 [compost metagenome]